jgi:hypothetical protein
VNCYLFKANQKIGPYSFEQIQAFLKQDMVSPSDLMWVDGWPDWIPVSNVPGLSQVPPSLNDVPPRLPINNHGTASLRQPSFLRFYSPWIWTVCLVILFFYEIVCLMRIGLFADMASLQQQSNFMSSDGYQTEKAWESFFRGFVGDMGTASEEENKVEAMNSSYSGDQSALTALFFIKTFIPLSLMALLVWQMFQHNVVFKNWKRMTETSDVFIIKDAVIIPLLIIAAPLTIMNALAFLVGNSIVEELCMMMWEPLIIFAALRIIYIVTYRYTI